MNKPNDQKFIEQFESFFHNKTVSSIPITELSLTFIDLKMTNIKNSLVMQFLMLNIYLTLVYYAEIKIKTLQT